jgi:hypothetical protein
MCLSLPWFIIGLGKGGERHIQMYGMITFIWFIIFLEKGGETHTDVWHGYL